MSQARLVALQLSIMKNDIRVINLDNKAVLRFLQEHNIFYEVQSLYILLLFYLMHKIRH